MSIPEGITLDHVLEAASQWDAGERPAVRAPSRYVAVLNGNTYDSKALVRVAARRVTGREPRPDELPGGLRRDRAAGFLKALGVEVRAIETTGTNRAEPASPPSAWLLQRSPDRFDLDGYLATTREILWPVTHSASRFAPGQTVFLWRNRGRSRPSAPGVVAVGVTTGTAQMRPDYDAALPYWTDAAEARRPALRVPVQVLEVATGNPVLGAERLRADSVCADLPHLERAVRTSYRLESRHAERLEQIWATDPCCQCGRAGIESAAVRSTE